MRRTALTLVITLISFTPVFAQQTQTPPPPPPPPPTVAVPRVATPPSPPSAPSTPRVAGVATGQTAPRAAAPAPVVASVSSPTSWQNVKIDVTISDSLSSDVQAKKTVGMLVLDGRSGQIRSMSGGGIINIDARPAIRPDGRIFLQVSIDYRPEVSSQQLQQAGLKGDSAFSESLALIVADGKPVLASQSADPRSDRRVAVEVTASVVK